MVEDALVLHWRENLERLYVKRKEKGNWLLGIADCLDLAGKYTNKKATKDSWKEQK